MRLQPLMSRSASQTQRPANINLQILAIMVFNFANYLTIGLPLAVLPGYVHNQLGFSAFWAGVAISVQYFATLLSRPHAGRYADLLGPKKVVLIGLSGCMLSGIFYLLAVWQPGTPILSLALLCVGRLVLGIGQSFAGTGATLWGLAGSALCTSARLFPGVAWQPMGRWRWVHHWAYGSCIWVA